MLVKVEPRAVYVSFRVFASTVEVFVRVPVLDGVSMGSTPTDPILLADMY
jgi:hypothetical protein